VFRAIASAADNRSYRYEFVSRKRALVSALACAMQADILPVVATMISM